MRAVVVYESMYGNTDQIAHAIGAGLASAGEVSVVAVEGATPAVLDGADLIVVGGPTHAHAMTRESTRKAAVDAAQKPDSELELDPDAEGPGLRDWFDELGPLSARRRRSTPVSTWPPYSPAGPARASPTGCASTAST